MASEARTLSDREKTARILRHRLRENSPPSKTPSPGAAVQPQPEPEPELELEPEPEQDRAQDSSSSEDDIAPECVCYAQLRTQRSSRRQAFTGG
jgi:hypothetical protein